ncbi:MAG: hypothetical protein M0R77_01180 [Gammaproteobacteria bacterium]|nr:hypothetical protein [Acholeplasmataceae bacterium]MCK9529169.1 hypothetical protein [Gammaproteobacteria bacterium]
MFELNLIENKDFDFESSASHPFYPHLRAWYYITDTLFFNFDRLSYESKNNYLDLRKKLEDEHPTISTITDRPWTVLVNYGSGSQLNLLSHITTPGNESFLFSTSQINPVDMSNCIAEILMGNNMTKFGEEDTYLVLRRDKTETHPSTFIHFFKVHRSELNMRLPSGLSIIKDYAWLVFIQDITEVEETSNMDILWKYLCEIVTDDENMTPYLESVPHLSEASKQLIIQAKNYWLNNLSNTDHFSDKLHRGYFLLSDNSTYGYM